ncbi:unnamed protein product [Spirodela intermedia]|uniref:Uncharacterized protein n=1 Tax=Spirodela intermedia TaxID=51605 RepID=A0A7I8KG98_SPIIN|nr:unnamed protein product [Spirodela intermedia]
MGKLRARDPVNVLFGWVRRQSVKVKAFLGAVTALIVLAALKLTVRDHNHFFVASEAVHAAGILVLVYKLARQKTCSGLSLKTQELTALFLAARLYCSMVMEKDIHTVLDFTTLLFTMWVIYMMRFKLKSTYVEDLDNLPRYALVVPCILLALLIHPYAQSFRVSYIIWAFTVYLEAISVLPQLHVMQNAKMVEPFTARYVFALGVARFLGCAHWILRIVESRGNFFTDLGSGMFWVPMVLLAEVVQTFILADFCYYYVKSVMYGDLLLRFPSSV